MLVIARGPAGTAAALSSPHCPDREGVVPCAAEPLPAEGSGACAAGRAAFRRPGQLGELPERLRHTPGCAATAPATAARPSRARTAPRTSPRPRTSGTPSGSRSTPRNAGGLTRAFSPPTAIVAATAFSGLRQAGQHGPAVDRRHRPGGEDTGRQPGIVDEQPDQLRLLVASLRPERRQLRLDRLRQGRRAICSRSDDIGKTIRFRVRARNASGSDKASSGPTAVVRAAARPGNTSPPTISGTPAEGATLAGSNGSWTHGPTSYAYAWYRCDRNGNNCAAIGGARSSSYRLTSADVGATLRLRVTAGNSEGSSSSTSVPTAVIQRAPAPPPSRGPGCPAGGNPDQVTKISPPARLLIDTLQADPRGRHPRDRGARRPLPRHLDLRRPRAGRARVRDRDAVQPVRRSRPRPRPAPTAGRPSSSAACAASRSAAASS